MSKKRILVACSMIENELNRILNEKPEILDTLELKWMDRGLHNRPDELRETLQGVIDELQEYDEILLAYGLCGQGTEGIKSEKAKLILPRFDDCINMMLCTGKRKTRGLVEAGNMYLTEGWIHDEEAILQSVEKYRTEFDYDDEMIEAVLDAMYGNYTYLSIIDTGCFDMAPVIEYADEIVRFIDLEVKTVPGSNHILEQLVEGSYDRNFIQLAPGEALTYNHFNLPLI